MDRPSAGPRHVLLRTLVGLGLKGAMVLTGFGMQIILAQTLGAEGLGVYAMFLAIATVLSVTGGLGMPMATIRFLALYARPGEAARLRGFLRAALALTLLSSTAAGLALVLACALVPPLRTWVDVAAAAAALVPLLALSTIAVTVLQAMGQPLRADLLVNLARQVFVCALVLAIGTVTGVNAALALALTGVAAAVALAAAATAAVRALPLPLRGETDSQDWRTWLAAGLTLVLSTLVASLIERLDTILLGVIVGAEAAGIYSVASRLALTVLLAGASAWALLAPGLARAAAADDRPALQRICALAAALTAGLTLLMAGAIGFAMPWLLPLFGPEFGPAGTPLLILLGGLVFTAALGNGGGALALAGQNRALIQVAVGVVILDILLCLALVPVFGPVGAAVATSLALIGQGLATAVLVHRRLGVDPTLLGALRVALEVVAAGRR